MKDKKQAPEIREEIIKKETRGNIVADNGEYLEGNQSTSFTPAGDRITPYKAAKNLGQKGNIRE